MRIKCGLVAVATVLVLSNSAWAQVSAPSSETPVSHPAPPSVPVVPVIPLPPVKSEQIPPPIAVPVLPVPSVQPVALPKPSLPGSFVYIYSYMDMRDEHFGQGTLTLLDEKIVAALKFVKASAKVVRYKSTEVYKQTLVEDEYSASQVDLDRSGQKNTRVDIEGVIAEKLADEKASGAKYRLILFPKNYTTSGAWRFYTLTWNLYDIETGRKVWQHTYDGEHLVWWKEEENPNGRTQKIVDDLVTALAADGLNK